jgi:hypothetical protein
MMRSVTYLILAAVIINLTASCKKEKETGLDSNCVYTAAGRWMGNPYEIGNLSARTGMKVQQASHLYVRVWITESEAFREWEAIGDFLPFDRRYEPQANGFHRLESGKGQGLWLYGMVPASAQLPGAYEVLEKCFLPEPGDAVWNVLLKENNNPEARNGVPIKGKLTFFDPISQQNMPLSGVKVIIQDGGRSLNAVTQEDGSFSNPNRIFASQAEVLLRFEDAHMEIRTLDLDNLGGILTPNILSFGMINQCAFENLQLEIGSKTTNATLQASAASWYVYNRFKEFATAKGYGIPPKKLNFWAARNAPINDSYSAPMLRHVGAQQGAKELLQQLFGLPPSIANPLSTLIKNDLPDVYAPYYDVNTNRTPPGYIETLFHEFGHSTHYVKAGNSFWSKYIEHIFTNGGYGDGTQPLSGLVAMSESWAEDFSLEVLTYFYGPEKYPPSLRDANTWSGYRWIPVGVYYDLHDDDGGAEAFDKVKGFSFKEMYDLFSPETDHPAKFRNLLMLTYPYKSSGQEADIEALYQHYGW